VLPIIKKLINYQPFWFAPGGCGHRSPTLPPPKVRQIDMLHQIFLSTLIFF
jgi:hypothetical protein